MSNKEDVARCGKCQSRCAYSSTANTLNPSTFMMHHLVQRSTTVRSAHIIVIYIVFIREQTATCATCSINWLVFITEMKSVYCAVRTGSLN